MNLNRKQQLFQRVMLRDPVACVRIIHEPDGPTWDT